MSAMTNEERKLRELVNGISAFTTREELMERITALISEGYVSKEKAGYPKEFVEWIGDDCSPCYLEREEDDYGKWVVFKRGSMEHKAEFDTLDELFNYWEENEQ